MAKLRFPGLDDNERDVEPIPFAGRRPRTRQEGDRPVAGRIRGGEHEALDAFAEVSRRMEDLARTLGCFGFFDDGDDDRPRAA